MVKIQRRDVRSLSIGISALNLNKGNDKYDQHTTYGTGKNRRIIRDEVESFDEAEKIKLEKYNDAIDKLNEENSEKSEDGNVVVNPQTGNVSLDPEKVYKYNMEMKKLKKKFKKEIDENNKFFKEEVELDLYMISNKYFPDLDPGIADYLFPIRKDLDVEEKEEAERLAEEKKEKEAEETKNKKK